MAQQIQIKSYTVLPADVKKTAEVLIKLPMIGCRMIDPALNKTGIEQSSVRTQNYTFRVLFPSPEPPEEFVKCQWHLLTVTQDGVPGGDPCAEYLVTDLPPKFLQNYREQLEAQGTCLQILRNNPCCLFSVLPEGGALRLRR